MTFGAPQYLYALIALPALMAFVWWAFSRHAATVRRIGDPDLIERLSLTVNRGMRRRRLVLWFIGIVLIIFALARPQWGSDVQIVEQRGVQVMVALDISLSMLAQDLKPSRLERAKLEIDDMMSKLTGDEVGIVLFSGSSFIQFPMTFDYATARTYLRHANPSIISRQGTVIEKAIRTSLTGFSEERSSQKIIVVMTDGENHEGDPVAAASEALEQGAVVYTVGFGSPEGEPLPIFDLWGNVSGYRQDNQGQVILSRLDEATLQRVAEAGGGKYFRAVDRGAIEGLVDEIESFQDESFQSEFNRTKIERFQIFLLAGILSLVLAEVMSDRLSISLRRRRATAVEEAGHA